MTASASRLAVAMAGAALLAGCAAISTAPPPLPPTFIPEIEPSSEPGSSYVSADGFDAVEHVAIRLRVETCTGYSKLSACAL